MAGWDPTARKGARSVIFHGGTPASFRRWLRGTVAYERHQQGDRVVFINAWNEWAEGAYLEPDRDFGRGWLEAMASVAKVSEAGVRAARANSKDGAHRVPRSQRVDRLFDIAEDGAVLSRCPLSIRPYVLELITTGVTVIRGSLPPSLCDEVRNGFVSFARQHDEIFRVNRDEYGHYPRIVNLHTAYRGLFDLFACNQVALAIQDYLFQAETVLYTSLFYERGSAQATHRDTPLFATRPEYRYFGTWVALEDTDADNGPLLVMRRGHLLPEIDREAMARRFYVNLDDLQPMSDDLWTCYQEEVAAQCARAGLGTQTLCVEKGDTIIWHPQTPHGGAEIRDLGRTRYSLVMHTTPFGVPVYHQDVFFHPSKPVSDKAPWDYVLRGQRRYADFREVSFGHVRDYPLEAFNVS